MMQIIFESNTETPEEFVLPDGEVVINFGLVQILRPEDDQSIA